MSGEWRVEWDAIFEKLEKWREAYLASAGDADDPSVTAIASDPRTDKPWAVLVSTVLSLRTKDEVTLRTSRALLGEAPTPQTLIALGAEKAAKLAYPAGFYRTKAANLVKIAHILVTEYGGKVPPDKDALLALPGVGLKTANLVLSEAFDLDAICVDIHVHRISNRLGWIDASTPDETEAALREILPRRYWKRINALLVLYGQQVCRPLSPHCSLCVIRGYCARRGVEKSR
jgi:endonuclease-3